MKFLKSLVSLNRIQALIARLAIFSILVHSFTPVLSAASFLSEYNPYLNSNHLVAKQHGSLSKDKKKGAISGAIGAVIAETVAENLPMHSQSVKSLDPELMKPSLPQNGEIAKLVATTVSTLSGLDAEVSLRTADNAVRNNLLNHIPDQKGVEIATDEFDKGLKYGNEVIHEVIEYAHDVIGQNPLIQKDPLARIQHEFRTFVAHETTDALLPTSAMGLALTVAPIGKAKDALNTGKAVGKKLLSSLTKAEAQLSKGLAEEALQQGVKKVAPKIEMGVAPKVSSKKTTKQAETPIDHGKQEVPFPGETSLSQKPVTIELKYKDGMNLRDFERKIRHLKKAADEGRLKTVSEQANRRGTTYQYRKKMEEKINVLYKKDEKAKNTLLERLQKQTDIDHKVDLQLGGSDVTKNLKSLDRTVNRSLGSQIQKQLPKEPNVKIQNIIVKKQE